MGRGARAGPLLLLGVVLGASLGAPAQGQQPGARDVLDELVLVDIEATPATQEVELLGQVVYDLVIRDLSAEGRESAGVGHVISLDLAYNRTAAAGWVAFLTRTYFNPSYAGQVHHSQLVVQASPTLQGQFFPVEVEVTLRSGTGQTVNDTVQVVTRLLPFSLATVDIRVAPPSAGPYEELTIPVHIGNVGQYPDTFRIEATGPEGWLVSAVPQITLWPGEEREVPIFIQTPASRVVVPQEAGIITVRIVSTLDTRVVYERSAVVLLEGVHVPGYWAPVLVLGVVLTGLVGRQAMEGARRSAREHGRPPRFTLTPAQKVMLEHLKGTDPARYKAMMGAQRRIFRARENAFLLVRDRRAAIERAMIARQHEHVRRVKAEEKARLRAEAQRAAELERRRAELERARAAEQRKADALRRREEQRLRREEERRARAEAPDRRREEKLRRERERQLRAEMARRKRELAVAERRRRIELEQRARLLARKKREAEKRLARERAREERAARKAGKDKAP